MKKIEFIYKCRKKPKGERQIRIPEEVKNFLENQTYYKITIEQIFSIKEVKS